MYQFILNMWILYKVTEEQVQGFVLKGYITQNECNMILATPQGGLNVVVM